MRGINVKKYVTSSEETDSSLLFEYSMLLSKSRFPLLIYIHTISLIILTSLTKTPGTPEVKVEDLGSRFDCVLEVTLNFSDKKPV